MRGANALTRRTNRPLLQKPLPQGVQLAVGQMHSVYRLTIDEHGLRVKHFSIFLLVCHREDNPAGMSCLNIDFQLTTRLAAEIFACLHL